MRAIIRGFYDLCVIGCIVSAYYSFLPLTVMCWLAAMSVGIEHERRVFGYSAGGCGRLNILLYITMFALFAVVDVFAIVASAPMIFSGLFTLSLVGAYGIYSAMHARDGYDSALAMSIHMSIFLGVIFGSMLYFCNVGILPMAFAPMALFGIVLSVIVGGPSLARRRMYFSASLVFLASIVFFLSPISLHVCYYAYLEALRAPIQSICIGLLSMFADIVVLQKVDRVRMYCFNKLDSIVGGREPRGLNDIAVIAKAAYSDVYNSIPSIKSMNQLFTCS